MHSIKTEFQILHVISFPPGVANPPNSKEIVGAAVNRLLRLAFALVKRHSFYQVPQLVEVVN